MRRELEQQRRLQAQMQAQMAQVQPKWTASPPNPENLKLRLFDKQTQTVEGPLDAREAMRRLLFKAPKNVLQIVGLRLRFTGQMGWHEPLRDAPPQVVWDPRPGWRIADLQISTTCSPAHVVAFFEDLHTYIEYDIACEPVGTNTKVILTIRSAPRTSANARLSSLAKLRPPKVPAIVLGVFLALSIALKQWAAVATLVGIAGGIVSIFVIALLLPPLQFMGPAYKAALGGLIPKVKESDPEFPAVYPTIRKGFRQPKKKKLEQQGMITDPAKMPKVK